MKFLSITTAVFLMGLNVSTYADTQVAGVNGNACRQSSGGVFQSDADGGISNTSTTEAMIIHCSIWLPRDVPLTGGIVLTQKHTTQPISCTVEERGIACGGICQVTSIFRKTLASATSTYWNGAVDRVGFNSSNGSGFFTANSLNEGSFRDSYHYVRCTIPPKQSSTAVASNIMAFRFWKSP